MTARVLIVEDEIIVAMEIEQTISDMGLDPVGIATDQSSALRLAGETDVALVDLNLRDGPTGITIGRILAQTHGATVIFLTANPTQLGDGVPGTVGVLTKPVTERDLRDAVRYAVARREEAEARPPQRLRLWDGGSAPLAT
jgi:DNA-binding response OmpR family regulator